jgi:hypothetical protein
MRSLIRFLAAFGAILALALIGVYLFRAPLVERVAERALAGAGFEKPVAKFGGLGVNTIALAEISAGGPEQPIRLKDVRLTFSAVALLFEGRAQSLSIRDAIVSARMNDKGAVEILGYRPPPPTGRAPPIDSVVGQGELRLETPQGVASFSADGALNLTSGGKFHLSGGAKRAGLADYAAREATITGDLVLAPDGGVDVDMSAELGFETPWGDARDVKVAVDAEIADWRAMVKGTREPLEGTARLSVTSGVLDATSAPSLASLASGNSPALRTLSVSGAVLAALSPKATTVSLEDGAILIRSDAGDALTITAGDGPLYRKDADGGRASLKIAGEGRAAGRATLSASAPTKGPWRIAADANFDDLKAFDYKFKSLKARFDGVLDKARIDGDIDLAADIARGAIGRLVFVDAPTRARARIAFDGAAKTARADLAPGACALIDAARMRIVGQDAKASLAKARLCTQEGAPFVAANWTGPLVVTLASSASAQLADYTLGTTLLEGAPPPVDFTATYEPEEQRTLVQGRIKGGDMTLNKSLRLTQSAGAFAATLVGETMRASADLSNLVVAPLPASPGATPMAAPVRAKGDLQLADDIATFTFDVATLKGAHLGKGEGRHAMRSGAGAATFNAGDLLFRPRMLQPEDLAPMLEGVVSNANGAATGELRFSWAPNIVKSSGDFALAGLSFNGPTLAVTRTNGLVGDIVLESLAPLKSKGVQTISIARIDLDALKLDNGEMTFELPGDDTIRIVKAEFPWFGGRIGAYETTAPLGGQSATTRLEIDAVNLSDLLAYLNVDGLSGEGAIAGVLPLVFKDGKARIEKGVLTATGPGVVRYSGKSTDAAADQNAGAGIAFEILRELRFSELTATIDGPLDGDLDFNIIFEGFSEVPVKTGGKTRRVTSPVIYRITVEAPLLGLIDQARITTDIKQQILRGTAIDPEDAINDNPDIFK